MSEYSIETLFELLNKYKVEVPIVQRDYAQGRHDSHTKMVRDNLLKDMESAILRETPPLDLNFVYGKAENGKFIPIDGQQRLTTLFLLHLYAFYNDDSKTELLQKFTYETRTSSRVFLEKLTQKRSMVFISKVSPSEEIEDSEWFVSGWKYDPTIQSVLTVLDDIKTVFGDIENLSQYLLNNEFKPIVFKFLEMKDLGMEDSLYIKLNARGKPLSSLENFKARLVKRLQGLNLSFTAEFEQLFDGKWTDLFWSNNKEDFDKDYLVFFGVLLRNKGICQDDAEWSNTLDYEKIDTEIYETAFYMLNFVSDNPDRENVYQLVFNALRENRTFQDRVLFHAISTYLYMAKGVGSGSFTQWLRILQNMTRNSQIDNNERYRSSINGVNKLADNWSGLLEYFSEDGNAMGFNQEQIDEERKKAKIILQNTDFAEVIYIAERHPYFSGQIRSALYLAKNNNGVYDKNTFLRYWESISALFGAKGSKYGHILRQALLALGNYTLSVGEYKTLCVDDASEAASTPSLKRLFSNNNDVVKCFLDKLNSTDDFESQLKTIVKNSTVPKNDWRHYFIMFTELFTWMSASHLRLREVQNEMFIIPNKASNGHIYDVFLSALYLTLKKKNINSWFDENLGTWADRYLCVDNLIIHSKQHKISISDTENKKVFETQTDDPVNEAAQYLNTCLSAYFVVS
ncbi:MAG: DUF262 domain-containing protein [Spirochaetaceae bacterium]|jgi:hypothetical protein|nr:DUF262 domain-containing protein [Spirochaetaceae bacterium]